jgi:hypothetical protein
MNNGNSASKSKVYYNEIFVFNPLLLSALENFLNKHGFPEPAQQSRLIYDFLHDEAQLIGKGLYQPSTVIENIVT